MSRWVTALVVAIWASAAVADDAVFKCDDNETVAKVGDRVTFQCKARIVSDAQLALDDRKSLAKDDLLKLLAERNQLQTHVDQLRIELTDSAKRLSALNLSAYEALKARYGELDHVAVQSIDNTRKAVKLARSIRGASYFTSALIAGGTGAYLGHQVGNGWKPAAAGAAIGALVGCAANWAVLYVTGLD